MGFLNGLGKFMQGKSVFSDDGISASRQASGQQTAGSADQNANQIPVITIDHIEHQPKDNGKRFWLSIHIKNNSSQTLELDKIRLLGTKKELDTYLKPGQIREFVVYDGPALLNRNHHDAYIAYKDETGDYFETRCNVEFRQESNKTYSVVRFHSVGPVKDI